jgi:hypothetical protein
MMRFALIKQSSHAPLGLVWRNLSRSLKSAPRSAVQRSGPSDDPVFLPDFVALTPDQVQEILYRKGRDQ